MIDATRLHCEIEEGEKRLFPVLFGAFERVARHSFVTSATGKLTRHIEICWRQIAPSSLAQLSGSEPPQLRADTGGGCILGECGCCADGWASCGLDKRLAL